MIEPGQLRRWADGLNIDPVFMTIRRAVRKHSKDLKDEIWWVLAEGGERWFFADDIESMSKIIEEE